VCGIVEPAEPVVGGTFSRSGDGLRCEAENVAEPVGVGGAEEVEGGSTTAPRAPRGRVLCHRWPLATAPGCYQVASGYA